MNEMLPPTEMTHLVTPVRAATTRISNSSRWAFSSWHAASASTGSDRWRSTPNLREQRELHSKGAWFIQGIAAGAPSCLAQVGGGIGADALACGLLCLHPTTQETSLRDNNEVKSTMDATQPRRRRTCSNSALPFWVRNMRSVASLRR